MKFHGKAYSRKQIMLKVLASLPSKFDSKVNAIEQSKDRLKQLFHDYWVKNKLVCDTMFQC